MHESAKYIMHSSSQHPQNQAQGALFMYSLMQPQSRYQVIYEEGREYEIPGEAELKNGEAIVNWKLSQTLPLNLHKSMAYPIEKKVHLFSKSVPFSSISNPQQAKSQQEQ